MIRCHLSTMMGRQKMKISDVARHCDINRSTVSALYYERATRVDLDAVEKICALFGCSVGELFEIVVSLPNSPASNRANPS